MPQPQPSFPTRRAIPFRLSTEAVAAAAAALREHIPESDKAQLVALDAAVVHLRGHAQLHLAAGKLLITSPRSSNQYTCTREHCTCMAAKNHLPWCWHRKAACIVRFIWDAADPRRRCPYCLGPMIGSHTYGGEQSYSCLVCQHEVMRTVASDLRPWPSSRPELARAA
jgi:hypothetical protein